MNEEGAGSGDGPGSLVGDSFSPVTDSVLDDSGKKEKHSRQTSSFVWRYVKPDGNDVVCQVLFSFLVFLVSLFSLSYRSRSPVLSA